MPLSAKPPTNTELILAFDTMIARLIDLLAYDPAEPGKSELSLLYMLETRVLLDEWKKIPDETILTAHRAKFDASLARSRAVFTVAVENNIQNQLCPGFDLRPLNHGIDADVALSGFYRVGAGFLTHQSAAWKAIFDRELEGATEYRHDDGPPGKQSDPLPDTMDFESSSNVVVAFLWDFLGRWNLHIGAAGDPCMMRYFRDRLRMLALADYPTIEHGARVFDVLATTMVLSVCASGTLSPSVPEQQYRYRIAEMLFQTRGLSSHRSRFVFAIMSRYMTTDECNRVQSVAFPCTIRTVLDTVEQATVSLADAVVYEQLAYRAMAILAQFPAKWRPASVELSLDGLFAGRQLKGELSRKFEHEAINEALEGGDIVACMPRDMFGCYAKLLEFYRTTDWHACAEFHPFENPALQFMRLFLLGLTMLVAKYTRANPGTSVTNVVAPREVFDAARKDFALNQPLVYHDMTSLRASRCNSANQLVNQLKKSMCSERRDAYAALFSRWSFRRGNATGFLVVS